MKVLALVSDAFGGNGGIARYNRDLMTALSCCEAVSQIHVLPRTATSSVPKPTKIQQDWPVSSRITYSQHAFSYARKRGPFDVLFCGHLFMLPLASVLARVFDLSLWLQVHGIEAWQMPGRILRRSLKDVTVVTSVSRFTRTKFLSWADIAPERVLVLPNTFVPSFRPGPKPAHLIARYGCQASRVLLTVSRLASGDKYKGHDRVIRLMPQLGKRIGDVKYVIAGDGDDRARLEHIANESGVVGSVIFAGHIPENELADFYRLADVFVMPSTGEGFGIVFLEAAAAGLPVIAGNRDGSVDALADGEIGILVDPEQPDEILEAICLAMCSDAADAQRVGRFEVENFRTHVDAIMRHVLTRTSRP